MCKISFSETTSLDFVVPWKTIAVGSKHKIQKLLCNIIFLYKWDAKLVLEIAYILLIVSCCQTHSQVWTNIGGCKSGTFKVAPLSNMKTIFYDREMKYFETISFLVNISILQSLQSGPWSICYHVFAICDIYFSTVVCILPPPWLLHDIYFTTMVLCILPPPP